VAAKANFPPLIDAYFGSHSISAAAAPTLVSKCLITLALEITLTRCNLAIRMTGMCHSRHFGYTGGMSG
jgi:hypothetical protein